MKKTVTIGWFEIPVADMERAIAFYQSAMDCLLERHPMGELDMAWFPSDESSANGAGGTLIYQPEYYKPSQDGILVYFLATDIEEDLRRIADAGGTILQAKTLISETIGYMALFLDSEGNRLALHEPYNQ
jgi:predicted enzyme related to lactoylglutathione lyase